MAASRVNGSWVGHILTDGVLHTMIYEMIVHPDDQHLAIGTQIPHNLLEWCNKNNYGISGSSSLEANMLSMRRMVLSLIPMMHRGCSIGGQMDHSMPNQEHRSSYVYIVTVKFG